IWVGHPDDGSNGDGTGGGDECADEAVHLARRSPAEGDDSEVNGDGAPVVVVSVEGGGMTGYVPSGGKTSSTIGITTMESAEAKCSSSSSSSLESSPDESPSSSSLSSPSMASTQALIDAVTAALPSPLLPPPPIPLYIPPPVDRKDDIPETEMLPRKRSCLLAPGSRYEIGESSTARPTGGRGIDYGFVSTLDAEARRRGIGEVRYGIRDTWVDLTEAVPEIPPMTLGEVNTRVTELAELHVHDTQDLYALLEDAQDSRTRISQQITMDS
nr:hypothetical protein [Tanacetum cinerariifolium]